MKRPLPVKPHGSALGVCAVEMACGRAALVSEADANAVREYRWWPVDNGRGRGYATTKVAGRKMKLHRFVANQMGLPATLPIDHVNGDGLDCRRENLRAATVAQNCWNQKNRRTNTSGIKGIGWSVEAQRWTARIGVNRKRIFLGRYVTKEEAEAVIGEARRRLHGEFARLA